MCLAFLTQHHVFEGHSCCRVHSFIVKHILLKYSSVNFKNMFHPDHHHSLRYRIFQSLESSPRPLSGERLASKYQFPSGPHLKVIVPSHKGHLSQLGTCYWHLVGRGQGCFSTSSNAQDRPPTTKNHPAPNVSGPKLGNTGPPDSTIDYFCPSLSVTRM